MAGGFGQRCSARPGRSQQSLPEHLAIIEAVCARDPEGAARAMREHLASVSAAIVESTRD